MNKYTITYQANSGFVLTYTIYADNLKDAITEFLNKYPGSSIIKVS